MKTIIAISTLALGMAVSIPALAADDDSYHASTTTVERNADGSTVVSTTRKQVEPEDHTVSTVTTVPGGSATYSKRVEKDYVDPYGNESKVVTNHTTDAYGNKITTRSESTTGE